MGGLGVDEAALVAALGRWRRQPERRAQFRRGFPGFFSASAGAGAGIERCEDEYLRHLEDEFARFRDAAVLWALHPWERDARWAHQALHGAAPAHPRGVLLVEVACTRAADDLLGARRAYQALHQSSLEEDVAYGVKDATAGVRASCLIIAPPSPRSARTFLFGSWHDAGMHAHSCCWLPGCSCWLGW